MLNLLEEISTNSYLGIQFWDPVLDQKIGDGLQVTARLEDAPRRFSAAYLTRSNVYSFRSLPGLRELEYSDLDVDQNFSPPVQQNYVIEVEDLRRRYVSVGFRVNLPFSYKGVFLSSHLSSPPQASPKGFFLYSSALRPIPPGMTVVRGELFDLDAGAVAAHAVIRVNTHEGFSWYGVADRVGRFAVVMPYPTLVEGIGGSLPPVNRKHIYEQVWDLQIQVLYQPGALQSLPGSDLKEYRSILQQDPAQIWPDAPGDGGAPTHNWQVQHRYGVQTILKTNFIDESTAAIDRRAKLLVTPAAAPV